MPDARDVVSPGVSVSFEVNLEQPKERMLRQKQSDTQGQKLPALEINTQANRVTTLFTKCHTYESEKLCGKTQKKKSTRTMKLAKAVTCREDSIIHHPVCLFVAH